LPPVSTTLAKLVQISPQIFEKIQNCPYEILWGGGKLIHEKNQKQKIL
jgi:hypothetical protein